MSVKSLLGESLKMEFRPTFHQCIHLPYQDPFIFLHLATVHLHQLHLSQLPRCLLATIVARWRITITLASLPEKLSQTSVLMILVHHFGVCIDLCLTLAPTVHKVWVVVSFNNCEYFKAGFSLGVNCHARDFLLFKLNGFLLYSTQKLKADFHSAFFVAWLFYWIVFHLIPHGSSEDKRKKSCARLFTTKSLKARFPFGFFCRACDFFLLSSEFPCGMKWKTIQFKQ